MAKICIILLTLVYAFSATGATVHLHYCCGSPQKIVTQAHVNKNHDSCALCTKHDDKNEDAACCNKDRCEQDSGTHRGCQDIKVEAKKTTEEHLVGDKNFTKIHPVELLVFLLVNFIDQPIDNHSAFYLRNTGPPLATIPLFIQHCTYRI